MSLVKPGRLLGWFRPKYLRTINFKMDDLEKIVDRIESLEARSPSHLKVIRGEAERVLAEQRAYHKHLEWTELGLTGQDDLR